MWQYNTPYSCPECGEHIFQTDADVRTELDFAGAECTSCGHALSALDIASQPNGSPVSEFATKR